MHINLLRSDFESVCRSGPGNCGVRDHCFTHAGISSVLNPSHGPSLTAVEHLSVHVSVASFRVVETAPQASLSGHLFDSECSILLTWAAHWTVKRNSSSHVNA